MRRGRTINKNTKKNKKKKKEEKENINHQCTHGFATSIKTIP